MKIYKLECIDQYREFEDNGYFLERENAEMRKIELDFSKHYLAYNIRQKIIEIELEDTIYTNY